MIITFEKTREDAIAPTHKHYDDAGYDMFIPEKFNDGLGKMLVKKGSTVRIPLGIKFIIPQNYMGLMMPRSSTSLKGLVSQIPPIDSGYRDEVSCILNNNSDTDYWVNGKDRVCQLVFVPIATPQLIERCDFDNVPKRGKGGFGSTGK